MNILINTIYWVITGFIFITYWTHVSSWYYGDVDLYGIIGAGIAANGAFIGNIIWTISGKNDVYKFNHNGEDMPFIKKIKSLFGIK